MTAKAYQFKDQILKEMEIDHLRLDQNHSNDLILCDVFCKDRKEATEILNRMGLPQDFTERLLNPDEYLRFDYYGDVLYGELSYYSLKSLKAYSAGMIIYKNSLIIVYEEDLGIRNRINRSSFFSEDMGANRDLKIEYILYVLVLELLSYSANIILKFRNEIERISREFYKNHEVLSTAELFNAKNRLTDYSLVVEHLAYSLSFPPAKEILDVKSTYRTYFTDLSKSLVLLQNSLTQAENKLDNLTDHFDFIQQEKGNKRLKYLTIIQAIFVPLTLIAGIYGMNFKVMPELEYENGYFVVLGVMTVFAILTWIYFYRNKWFD